MNVIREQAMSVLYDALDEINCFKSKFATIPRLIDLITVSHDKNKNQMIEEIWAISHYAEILLKELEEQTTKAEDCYFRIKEQGNGN